MVERPARAPRSSSVAIGGLFSSSRSGGSTFSLRVVLFGGASFAGTTRSQSSMRCMSSSSTIQTTPLFMSFRTTVSRCTWNARSLSGGTRGMSMILRSSPRQRRTNCFPKAAYTQSPTCTGSMGDASRLPVRDRGPSSVRAMRPAFVAYTARVLSSPPRAFGAGASSDAVWAPETSNGFFIPSTQMRPLVLSRTTASSPTALMALSSKSALTANGSGVSSAACAPGRTSSDRWTSNPMTLPEAVSVAVPNSPTSSCAFTFWKSSASTVSGSPNQTLPLSGLTTIRVPPPSTTRAFFGSCVGACSRLRDWS